MGDTAQPVLPGYLLVDSNAATSPDFVPSVPSKSVLNITASTVVKFSPGVIGTVCLNTAASSESYILDSTTSSVTASTTILAIPSASVAGTVLTLNWPCATGIAMAPGTGGVFAISYQ